MRGLKWAYFSPNGIRLIRTEQLAYANNHSYVVNVNVQDNIVTCFLRGLAPSETSSSAVAERPRELGDFNKARVNGGTNNHSVMDSHKCLRWR